MPVGRPPASAPIGGGWPNSDVIATQVQRCYRHKAILLRKVEDTPKGYRTTYRCPMGHTMIMEDVNQPYYGLNKR